VNRLCQGIAGHVFLMDFVWIVAKKRNALILGEILA
jgi:hypothetical protein